MKLRGSCYDSAEGFYLSSTVDNVGGIGIVKGVKNAVSVKFILSSYYARVRNMPKTSDEIIG